MTIILRNQADLENGLAALIKQDPRLEAILAKAGIPALRRRDAGFAGLCAIVMGQQLSVASARAIWERFETAFDPFHHDTIRRARAGTLARIGLSKPKIKTVKEVSKALARGEIDLTAIADMDADVAHQALTALHGVGPWTADIYLLFCLGHADAWPAGDLAVQEAIRLAFGLEQRPTAKAMGPLADIWRPWRGVAAHLFWQYYKVAKGRDAVPVQHDATAKKGNENGGIRRTKARGAKARRTKPHTEKRAR